MGHEATEGVSDAVPRRFSGGDGLRAIAAMSVLVFHAAIATLLWKSGSGAVNGESSPHQFKPLFGPAAAVFVNMRAGIYIFFVLSGYLLTRPFLAAYILSTPVPSIPRYMRNRALRIIPAFWVVTLVYFLWDRAHTSGGAAGLLADLGFAQNYFPKTEGGVIGQAWTLDLEVAFYILIPAVTLAALAVKRRWPGTPRGRLAFTLGALLAAYAGSLYLKHVRGNPISLEYDISQYLFAFIPGVAIAAIEPFAAPHLRSSPTGRRWVWVAALACVALLVAFVAVPMRQVGTRLVLVTLGCGALMAAPLAWQWHTGGSWRLLDNRPMRWLGERSYGIYLIHLGLMTHVLARFGHSHGLKVTFVLLLGGVTLVTLIAADVLWRVVEQPALQRRMPWRSAEFRRSEAAQVPVPHGPPAQVPAGERMA